MERETDRSSTRLYHDLMNQPSDVSLSTHSCLWIVVGIDVWVWVWFQPLTFFYSVLFSRFSGWKTWSPSTPILPLLIHFRTHRSHSICLMLQVPFLIWTTPSILSVMDTISSHLVTGWNMSTSRSLDRIWSMATRIPGTNASGISSCSGWIDSWIRLVRTTDRLQDMWCFWCLDSTDWSIQVSYGKDMVVAEWHPVCCIVSLSHHPISWCDPTRDRTLIASRLQQHLAIVCRRTTIQRDLGRRGTAWHVLKLHWEIFPSQISKFLLLNKYTLVVTTTGITATGSQSSMNHEEEWKCNAGGHMAWCQEETHELTYSSLWKKESSGRRFKMRITGDTSHWIHVSLNDTNGGGFSDSNSPSNLWSK